MNVDWHWVPGTGKSSGPLSAEKRGANKSEEGMRDFNRWPTNPEAKTSGETGGGLCEFELVNGLEADTERWSMGKKAKNSLLLCGH